MPFMAPSTGLCDQRRSKEPGGNRMTYALTNRGSCYTKRPMMPELMSVVMFRAHATIFSSSDLSTRQFDGRLFAALKAMLQTLRQVMARSLTPDCSICSAITLDGTVR